ncbi:hypothetical protein [Microbacterium sp. KR10-403]|uniref:hypothetical protein n=1 Tax=Microbacterium sp. KR10-403 TaxID=3158581 RepID=UPI0032E3EE56
MNEDIGDRIDEVKDGLVQLRFADTDGHVHDINAAELSEVLQGLVEFTDSMAKSGVFGDGIPPEVRVRPPKPGSFIVEAIIQWAGQNPEAAIGIATTAGGAVVQALHVGIRRLRGIEPTDFEYLANGQVKVQWPDKTVSEIPNEAWKKLKALKRPTKKSLRKILAPLGDDIAQLEIRDGSMSDSTDEILAETPAVVADRTDYITAAHEPDEVEESTEMIEVEGQLASIDFRPGQKWRVETPIGSRLATMEDEDFLIKLDRGMALHKNDVFMLRIREDLVVKNGRASKEWAVVRAERIGLGVDDEPIADAAGDEARP